MLSLVLGGEKSGKSDLALELLAREPGPHAFIPTGKACDDAFRAQIAAHRAERDPRMPVLESAGLDLPEVLARAGSLYGAILVDSLDFWVFACSQTAKTRPEPENELLACLDNWAGGSVVLVSCEVGLGPVAAGAQTRAFVRRLGRLNRAVAKRAHRVCLCVAGLPVTLKGPPPTPPPAANT